MQFTVTEVAFAASAFGAVLGATSSKILDLASAAYRKKSVPVSIRDSLASDH